MPRTFLRLTLLGYVANDAQHSRALRGAERFEHNVDGKLGPVLAQTVEIQSRTHLAGTGMCVVVFAMRGVMPPKTIRHKTFNRFADQFSLCVTKQIDRTRIRGTDYAGGIRDKDCVRRDIE